MDLTKLKLALEQERVARFERDYWRDMKGVVHRRDGNSYGQADANYRWAKAVDALIKVCEEVTQC